MENNITVQDALGYIRQRGKILKDWPDDRVITLLSKAVDEDSIIHSVDEKTGLINGILVARVNHNSKIFHVSAIQTDEPSVMPSMILWIITHFPDYTISAHRKGQDVVYDVYKLCKSILKLTKKNLTFVSD